jgi:acetolactate decarboxylase
MHLRLLLLFLLPLLSACHSVSSDGPVSWVGSQHEAVHNGDSKSKVRLSDLTPRPHVYAIGPLEDLAGEITVLDNLPSIATVDNGQIRTQSSLNHGAAFLVWTRQAAWTQHLVPDSVRTMDDLAAYLPAAARDAGLNPDSPFAFRIEGVVQSLKFHVITPPESPTFEAHEKSKFHSQLNNQPVHMIGFYSTKHRGIFTPGNSDLHIHFVSENGQLSGHVETVELAPGVQLLLPATESPPAPPLINLHLSN